jgi:branched-subunit amino acid ABC-type transport system permease component
MRRVGATVIPALAVLAVQLIFFPMPFGVVLEGVIVGLLGALVAVGMALIYRANRVLNFAQVQLGLAPTVLAVSLTRTSVGSGPGRPDCAERHAGVTLGAECHAGVTLSAERLADGAAGAFPELCPDGFLVRLAQPGQRQRVDDHHPLG